MTSGVLFNRLLRYHAVGFDIDLTLGRYQLRNLIGLIYEQLADYLVGRRGYPQSLRRLDWSRERGLMSRAAVLDKARGNLLLLGTDGRVLRACHGTRRLSGQDILNCYPPLGRPEFADQLLASGYRHERNGRYRFHDTHYDLPGSLVFARLVDIAEERSAAPLADCSHLWRDCLDALLHVYAIDGPYFRAVLANPTAFLCPVEPQVRALLAELRRRGRYLFLLSSSVVDFADSHLSYILGGQNWSDQFDCVVLAADKPAFFDKVGAPTMQPLPRLGKTVYAGGSSVELRQRIQDSLTDATDASSIRIAYFGDSVRSDSAAAASGWDAWMVVEELLASGTSARGVPGLVDRLALPLEVRRRSLCPPSDAWPAGLCVGDSDDGDGGDFVVDGRPTLWASTLADRATAVVACLEDILAAEATI